MFAERLGKGCKLRRRVRRKVHARQLSLLPNQALRGACFNSFAGLEARIDTFIDAYNDSARPFEQTVSQVH